MRRSHFDAFAPLCPVCMRGGQISKPLILSLIVAETARGIDSGILRCAQPDCQHEYPIIDGIPIIVPELRRLLSDRGVELLNTR